MSFINSANFTELSPQDSEINNLPAMPLEKNQRGFTLLELLMALAVFMVAMAAVFQLLQLGTMERNTVSSHVDSVKAARIAVNYMRRDILNAGFSYHNTGGTIPDNWSNLWFNAPADADAEADFLTSIVASNNTNTNTLLPASPTDGITVMSRDLTFNNGNLLNFTATKASGKDVLVTTTAGGTSACQLYDMYLFETDTKQTVGMVTQIVDANTIRLGFGDPLGVNLSATGSGEAQSVLVGTGLTGTMKKINIISYSVVNGTLIRRTYGNQPTAGPTQQINTHELIYNVQNMQITYLMNDGTVTDDPSGGNNGRTNQQKMNQVVDVELNLQVMEPPNGQPMVTTPVTIKEIISTRNLRYTIG